MAARVASWLSIALFCAAALYVAWVSFTVVQAEREIPSVPVHYEWVQIDDALAERALGSARWLVPQVRWEADPHNQYMWDHHRAAVGTLAFESLNTFSHYGDGSESTTVSLGHSSVTCGRSHEWGGPETGRTSLEIRQSVDHRVIQFQCRPDNGAPRPLSAEFKATFPETPERFVAQAAISQLTRAERDASLILIAIALLTFLTERRRRASTPDSLSASPYRAVVNSPAAAARTDVHWRVHARRGASVVVVAAAVARLWCSARENAPHMHVPRVLAPDASPVPPDLSTPPPRLPSDLE